jgi:hypothetical protein
VLLGYGIEEAELCGVSLDDGGFLGFPGLLIAVVRHFGSAGGNLSATFSDGHIAILNSGPVFEHRAAGRSDAIASYLGAWSAALRERYALLDVPLGTRELYLSIGTRGRHKAALVSRDVSPTMAEHEAVRELAMLTQPRCGLLQPIMMISEYCVSERLATNPSELHERTTTFQLPDEWRRALPASRSTIEDVLDALWPEPPVPDTLGRFHLARVESHPDPAKGSLYRYSDDSAVQLCVFVYPVPLERRRTQPLRQCVQVEGGAFVDELGRAKASGFYQEWNVEQSRIVAVIVDGVEYHGHEISAVVRLAGGALREEQQHLYMIGADYVKLIVALPSDRPREALAANLAPELMRALITPRPA